MFYITLTVKEIHIGRKRCKKCEFQKEENCKLNEAKILMRLDRGTDVISLKKFPTVSDSFELNTEFERERERKREREREREKKVCSK